MGALVPYRFSQELKHLLRSAAERLETEVIEDEELHLGELLEDVVVGAIITGLGQLVEEPGRRACRRCSREGDGERYGDEALA